MEDFFDFQGKYDDAERLFLEAIKIGETTLGKEHPDVATRYNNLVLVYDAQVRFFGQFSLNNRAPLLSDISIFRGS